MSKSFGICMSICDIIDEFNSVKKLQISDVVQIAKKIENEEKFAIKLMDEGPLKFGKTIYVCESEHITIVSDKLVKYLVGADYWGRLDILRFKKKIEKLKVDSIGNLQVVFDGDKYIIRYIVTYIGEIPVLGVGLFVGIKLGVFSNKSSGLGLIPELFRQFGYGNDQTKSLFTVRVEQLFNEIELVAERTPKEHASIIQTNSGTGPSQIDAKELPIVGSPQSKGWFKQILELFQNKCERPTVNPREEVKCNTTIDQCAGPQYSSGTSPTITKEDSARNREILKSLDLEKETSKKCYQCERPGHVFKISCNHMFCPKCLSEQSESIRQAKCPICSDPIKSQQMGCLYKFLQKHLNLDKPRPFNANNNYIDHTDRKNSVCMKTSKKCWGCEKTENTFKFLCNHSFCHKCVLDRLDIIKCDGIVKCPVCDNILTLHQTEDLDRFIETHLEGN